MLNFSSSIIDSLSKQHSAKIAEIVFMAMKENGIDISPDKLMKLGVVKTFFDGSSVFSYNGKDLIYFSDMELETGKNRALRFTITQNWMRLYEHS